MLNFLKSFSKKQLIGLILLIIIVISIPVGVILVQRSQILKSRATENWLNAFEIKDASGSVVICDSSVNPPTCSVQTDEIEIKIKALDPLVE